MIYPRKKIQITNLFYIVCFATVFFIVLIINSMFTTFVYLPGITVNLSTLKSAEKNEGKSLNENLIRIKSNGNITYNNHEYTESDFLNFLKDKSRNKLLTNIFVAADAGVSANVIAKITDQIQSLNISARYVYNFPDLPAFESSEGLIGAALFTVIDPNGLFYFQDQAMEEDQFRANLAKAVQRSPESLTLVILADKSVPYEFIVKASSIAQTAGIKRLLFATRPPNQPSHVQ